MAPDHAPKFDRVQGFHVRAFDSDSKIAFGNRHIATRIRSGRELSSVHLVVEEAILLLGPLGRPSVHSVFQGPETQVALRRG